MSNISENLIELRFQPNDLLTDDDGNLFVKGYVNKTNQRSEVLSQSAQQKFVEKIKPGVFKEAIENRDRDIDFLTEHDSKRILSSTRNNSLLLEEDKVGLYMEATITPTSWGKDAHTLIKAGILKNMSFGFKVIKDSWKRIEGNLLERTIEQIRLFEVSVVKDPAYSQSTIEARGIEVIGDIEIPIEFSEEKNMEKIISMIEALDKKIDSVSSDVSEVKQAQAKVELRNEGNAINDIVQPLKEAILEALKEERSKEDEELEQSEVQKDEDPVELENQSEESEKAAENIAGEVEDNQESEDEQRSLEPEYDSILKKLNQLKQGE